MISLFFLLLCSNIEQLSSAFYNTPVLIQFLPLLPSMFSLPLHLLSLKSYFSNIVSFFQIQKDQAFKNAQSSFT